MDRTGKVDGAYRKLRQKQDEDKRLAVKPATGKFRTIVIDPPWDHEGLSLAGRGRPEYAVMSQEELLALPVANWSDEDCHLYLWVTNNFLPRAFPLIASWGFSYKTCLTWVKPRIGLGSYFRSSTEHCLFALRGKASTRVKDIATHMTAPVATHSEKPVEFFTIAERASYPPYLEVFSRTERPNWAAWGTGSPNAE
jgi:N6-adenosine-specific RNA methylase IME4